MCTPFDRIVIMHVDATGDDKAWTTMKNIFEADLISCGVAKMKMKFERVPIRAGNTLQATLIATANAVERGVLVMGSAGSGEELKESAASKGQRVIGEAPIGSVAIEVMNKVRNPLILVKKAATSQVENLDAMRRRREGHKDVGLHILCAVDGGRLSQKCFDFAAHMASSGDQVTVLNVTDSDVAMRKPKAEANDMLGDSAIKSYYVNECGKAEMTGDATFQFVTEYKKGTVRDTITGFSEREPYVDFLIMGSIELERSHAAGVTAMGSISGATAKRCASHIIIIKSDGTE